MEGTPDREKPKGYYDVLTPEERKEVIRNLKPGDLKDPAVREGFYFIINALVEKGQLTPEQAEIERKKAWRATHK